MVIANEWKGHLPFTVTALDLTRIYRLAKLEHLEIRKYDYSYVQLYPLKFGTNSFQPLKQLKELSIRIPLEDRDLGDMVAPLTSLEVFDISYTRGLSLHNLTKTLGRISKSTIRYLCLRTFQLIGADGYTFQLTMRNLTGNNTAIFHNLIEIDLSDNSLARIEPGIYHLAPNLHKFDVSGNILVDSHNVPLIMEGLNHPNLEELNLGFQGYIGGTHPLDTLGSINITQRQKRSVDMMEQASFKRADHKHHFDIEKSIVLDCINRVCSRNVSRLMTSSKILCNLLQCIVPIQFEGFPCDLLRPFNETFDPNCYLYTRIPIGQNLKVFLFGNVHWEEASTTGLELYDNICFTNNSLKTFVFSSNAKWIKAGKIATSLNEIKSITGLENIRTIAFDKNNLNVNISFLTAANLPNLMYIDVSSNRLQIADDYRFCSTVVTKLTEINLSSNNLKTIPSRIIVNCSALSNMNLSNNKLQEDALIGWDLNGTDRLENIDLSKNSLKSLDATFRHKLHTMLQKRTLPLMLDINDNQLSCGCFDIEFVDWISSTHQQNEKLKFVNFEKYTCSGQQGYEFFWRVDVDILKKKCIATDTLIYTVTFSCIGMLLVVCMIFGLYCVRWRVKYHLHQGKKKLKNICCSCRETTPAIKYTYDAFVSYCADDRFWVHDVLMRTLESTYGFHLCIHYRDFPVGGDIFHTIAEHMTDSNIIILVVSDISMASRMCQFEMDEAQRQNVEQRKKILLIKLGSITRPLPDETVAFLLDRHTYLEWSDDHKSHKLFWAKLVGHLYNDFQGSANRCCCPYGARSLGYEEI